MQVLITTILTVLAPAESAAPAPSAPAAAATTDSGARPPARWHDAADAAEMVGAGSIELCEALTLPLGWVPEVGTVLEIGAEIVCLLPGGVGADYVERQHGTRRGWVWQGTAALALGKAWRDGTRILVGGGIAAAAAALVVTVLVGGGILGVTVWPAAPLFIPLVAAGVLTTAALAYVGIREIRKTVQEKIFHAVYGLLTPEYRTVEAQQKSQSEALVRPRLNILERWWLLAAISGGAEAEGSWKHAVPVVGPVLKARSAAAVSKDMLRRTAAEDIREQPGSWERVDRTIDVFAVLDGGLGAAAHAALLVSLGILGVGAVAALLQVPGGLTQPQPTLEFYLTDWRAALMRTAVPALLTGLLGVAALACVGGGIGFILAREVPKKLKALVVPVVFGLFPDGAWFPARNEPKPKVKEPPKKDPTDDYPVLPLPEEPAPPPLPEEPAPPPPPAAAPADAPPPEAPAAPVPVEPPATELPAAPLPEPTPAQ